MKCDVEGCEARSVVSLRIGANLCAQCAEEWFQYLLNASWDQSHDPSTELYKNFMLYQQAIRKADRGDD